MKIIYIKTLSDIQYAAFINIESNLSFFDLVSNVEDNSYEYIEFQDGLITIGQSGYLADIEIITTKKLDKINFNTLSFPVSETLGLPVLDTINVEEDTKLNLFLSINSSEGIILFNDFKQLEITKPYKFNNITFFVYDDMLKAIRINSVINDSNSAEFGKWLSKWDKE